MDTATDPQQPTRVVNHRTRKLVLRAFAGVAVLIVALLLWALVWPVNDCDSPRCARQRYSVALEIDALGKVEPIEFELENGSESISLAAILRGGGVELRPKVDQVGLPYDPTSGPLDRADLFQFVSAWRNQHPDESADAALYALFVSSLIADDGKELFGIMFDTAGREGFAVAPRTIKRFYSEHEPSLIETLQLRTFAHELLHALNRHHMDAALMHDGRLTLEAPTRCISTKAQRGWTLHETPLMELSPHTIRFFQTAAPRDVLPGRDNAPFTNRRASPTECDDARARIYVPEDNSRWSVAMRRLQSLLALSSAHAAEEEEPAEATLPTPPQAEITLQAQTAAYPLGYPIAIRIMVQNTGEESLPVVGRLNPRYGMLTIEHREVGAEDWQHLGSLTLFESTGTQDALLQPGARTEETVPIYFGEDGWTFKTPGEYELRARLQVGASGADLLSEPITISVAAPITPDDQAALQPLLDDEDRLATDIGRLLYFDGRIGGRDDVETLELAVENHGHTAVGGALRLTLLSQSLRGTIDPKTGQRPPPDLEDARELIEDTCTDSGVAAMTSEVLQQRADSLPATMRARAASGAVAWDGITADQGTVPTYSDPMLSRRGPSLHFCFNETSLRRPVRNAISKLARQLRRERPSRIVLVGHSDSVGTCRYNDSLALQRAGTVAQALARSGVRGTKIEIVSIGERRPMNFATAEDAQMQNRRVEVLVEGPPDDGDASQAIPRCPAHAGQKS